MTIAPERLGSDSELVTRVFDSLSAHIAVLDSQGTIIGVNHAWENFAVENCGTSPLSQTGVGSSYLAVCERAARDSDPDAVLVLEGLRGVLSGSLPSFVHEYPCNSPTQERWFQIQAFPLSGPLGGAAVVHNNTTPQKLVELGLRHQALSKANLLRDMVAAHAAKISDTQIAMMFALAKLAESRDGETGRHLERIRESCGTLAFEVGKLPAYANKVDNAWIRDFMNASPLHDIGKVGIPDAILLKPGRLTAEEKAVMETHTTIGAMTLRAVAERHPGNEFLEFGIEVAWSHHERWDGKGYPRGLAGTEIPLSARILSVADTYDAVRSRRVYKSTEPHEKAVGIILSERGKQFDPDIVDVFVGIEDRFREQFGRNNDSGVA